MSSFNRRFFMLSAAALGGTSLSGCGFEPVYGTDGAASMLLNNVLVDEPKANESYVLVRELENRLGQPGGAPEYGLSLALHLDERGVGRTSAQVTNRFDVIGSVTYALRGMDNKEVRTTGKVSSFTSYSASGSTVSELAAKDDAYERLMVILADRIVVDLQAYAASETA
jgi:LPS-assembly lipoprotein